MSSKKVRVNLWRRNPHCYWCQRLTRLYKGQDFGGQPPPGDQATIDHIYSKNREKKREEARLKTVELKANHWVVLACHECNRNRNIIETKAIARAAKEGKLLEDFLS